MVDFSLPQGFREAANKAGAIPFVGTVVGAVRFPIALITLVATCIIGLVGAMFMGVAWTFHSKLWKWEFIERSADVFCDSIKHLFVGLFEIIPGVGSCLHYALHKSSDPGGQWRWREGGCCETID